MDNSLSAEFSGERTEMLLFSGERTELILIMLNEIGNLVVYSDILGKRLGCVLV